MAEGVKQEMEQIQLESKDKSLNDILRSTEAQTETELKEASQRTTYLQEYMTLNQDLATKIDGFLDANQTYTDRFKTLIAHPGSASAWGRLLGKVPLLGRFAKKKLSPSSVAEVIMEMYTNMILQKDAVAKQLKLIEERREDLFKQSEQAAQDLETASENFENTKGSYDGLNASLTVAQEIADNNGQVGEVDVSAIMDYHKELGFKKTRKRKLTRINLPKLTKLVDRLEKETTEAKEEQTKYEIELNAANSAIKGYRIQKDQFHAYVQTTKVLLFGLETHLKYSKTLVENQAILAQAQDTAIKALEAYNQYQEAINQTFILNSIGVQVMARETAAMLSRDMFDEGALEEARARVREGEEYWDNFRSEYTNKAEVLHQKIQESKAPTA